MCLLVVRLMCAGSAPALRRRAACTRSRGRLLVTVLPDPARDGSRDRVPRIAPHASAAPTDRLRIGKIAGRGCGAGDPRIGGGAPPPAALARAGTPSACGRAIRPARRARSHAGRAPPHAASARPSPVHVGNCVHAWITERRFEVADDLVLFLRQAHPRVVDEQARRGQDAFVRIDIGGGLRPAGTSRSPARPHHQGRAARRHAARTRASPAR